MICYINLFYIIQYIFIRLYMVRRTILVMLMQLAKNICALYFTRILIFLYKFYFKNIYIFKFCNVSQSLKVPSAILQKLFLVHTYDYQMEFFLLKRFLCLSIVPPSSWLVFLSKLILAFFYADIFYEMLCNVQLSETTTYLHCPASRKKFFGKGRENAGYVMLV